MKKIFLVVLVTMFASHDVFGLLNCTEAACMVGAEDYKDGTPYPIIGCKTYESELCVNGYRYKGCATCESGYTKTTGYGDITGCNRAFNTCKSNGSTTCSATSSSNCTGTAATISNCSTSTLQCFGGQKVRTCTKCASGYTLTNATLSVSGCSNSYSYKKCVSSSIGQFCPIGKTWSEKLQKCVCQNSCGFGQVQDEDTCECTTLECLDGQYANSFIGTCLSCPGLSGATASSESCGPHTDSGATAIMGCYYNSAECTYTDDTGTFIWTQNCNYSRQ